MTEQAADGTAARDESVESEAFAHGSLGRLAPTWWEPEEGEGEPEPWLTADEALDRFLGWVAARGIELWPHQEEALMDLMVGDHVILGTPTGSGTSLVALGLHFMALATGRRAYYTAPIKALVSARAPTWAAWPWTSSTSTATPTAAGHGRCRCSRCRRPSSCS